MADQINTEKDPEPTAITVEQPWYDLGEALGAATESVVKTTEAFSKLSKKAPKTSPKPKRGKRSRSRQCRGGRKRNMLRAAERSIEANADPSEQQAIVSEAKLAGAILDHGAK